MPALASRSLWEQPAPPFGSVTFPPYTITGVAEPLWGTVGDSVNIALFVQTIQNPAPSTNPNNPGYFTGVDLPAPVFVVITFPDKSTLALTSTSVPAIVHTLNSGQYNLYVNRTQTGRYGYTWYQAGTVVFSGEFFATASP